MRQPGQFNEINLRSTMRYCPRPTRFRVHWPLIAILTVGAIVTSAGIVIAIFYTN